MKSEGPEKVPAPGSRRGVSKLHEGISSHCWCELSDRVAPKTTAQRVMGWFEFSQCCPCLRGDFLSRTDSPRRTRRTQRTETLQIKGATRRHEWSDQAGVARPNRQKNFTVRAAISAI